MQFMFLFLILFTQAFATDIFCNKASVSDCEMREAKLNEALKFLSAESPIDDYVSGIHGLEITGVFHPLAAMSFDLETRKILIYDGGLAMGTELMASSLFHEIRHKDISTHTICVKPSPLAGAPACDADLPALADWKSGGSYVYELAFQREAIQKKIPGHEVYIRQFIGNLHIRFSNRPDLAVIDEWIGPELLESQKDFIKMVRARYFSF